jgi:opacity protein-like surface antigen
MFKKILLGSLAAATMTASAYAADLRAAPPPPPPPVPVCIWCGAYIGVNGGGAWTRSQSLLYTETFGGAPFFPAAGGFNEFGPLPSRSGGFGGGQIGIKWQWGMFVAGGELDFQGARINSAVATSITPYLAPGGVISIATNQRIDYFGTARGRVGITFGGFGGGFGGYGGPGGPGGFGLGGPILLYVTGGFAYAGVRDAFVMTDTFGFTAAMLAATAAPAIRSAAASSGCSCRTGRSRANTSISTCGTARARRQMSSSAASEPLS